MFTTEALFENRAFAAVSLLQLRSDLQMFFPPSVFHFLLPHILYQYLPDPKRPALKMKERNFTLCQKKEWKLRAVSDN